MAHDVNFRMEEYSRIYRSLRPHFEEADYTFGQLEFVVDGDREMAGYPSFNVHPNYVEAAIDSGVNVFSLANNHTTDYGSDGVDATRRTMERLSSEHDIYYSGVRHGVSSEEQSPNGDMQPASDGQRADRQEPPFEVVEIEREGVIIGFLAITRILNSWNGSERTNVVTHGTDSEHFLSELEQMTSGYDLFILSVHDGTEYQPVAGERYMQFYRQAVGAGVDILWGHHPHVLQQWETVRREDGRTAVIMPSMGNFVSGQTWGIGPGDTDHWRAETGDSALFRLTVEAGSGGADIRSIDPLPITHFLHPEGGVTVEMLMPMPNREDAAEWRPFYRDRRRRTARYARRREYSNLGGRE